MGAEFQLGKMEGVLEMKGGDRCTRAHNATEQTGHGKRGERWYILRCVHLTTIQTPQDKSKDRAGFRHRGAGR